MPLTDTANYTRSLVYDEASRTVFVGTGTQVNLFGCSIDTDECEDLTDLLSPEIQDSVEVRRMVASEGYVLAWAGDGGSWGNDWLIVLDVERSAAGDLRVEVVDEIKGVAFPGSSPVVEDHVYYTKAGYEGWPLFRYNVVTGEETQLPKDVEILARQWDVIELDDPQWPGPTLVELDSYGSLARYNIETETMDVQSVPDVPEVSLRINSIATGPDGSLWSSGYLHGGIGHYTPMRDDEQETFNVGGQAEQMTAHDGRMFQGTYPNGTITSFTEAQLRNRGGPADLESRSAPVRTAPTVYTAAVIGCTSEARPATSRTWARSAGSTPRPASAPPSKGRWAISPSTPSPAAVSGSSAAETSSSATRTNRSWTRRR